MTDERLLEQAASGDETAFAVIYERHRGLVFRFAYRLSQSRELAEEITHDSAKATAARFLLRTWVTSPNLPHPKNDSEGHLQ